MTKEIVDTPCEYLDSGVLARQYHYWRGALQDVPRQLHLPYDRPRPDVPTHGGAHLEFKLPKALGIDAHQLAQEEDATLFMVLLSAFALLLSRYSGQDDFVIGTPVTGRQRPELESLIGCFVNTLPLRTNLTGCSSFRDIVRKVRELALGAFEHQDVPFEKLIEELHIERDPGRSSLFQVMFVLQNAPEKPLDLDGLRITLRPNNPHAIKYDLTLYVWEIEKDLQFLLIYATELFEEAAMQRMLEHLQLLLEQAMADPDRPLDQLSLLTPQQQALLNQVNATAAAVSASTFLDLFAQSVRQAPLAPAIVYEQQQWSYEELEQWAKRIAAHLQAAGVGRQAHVGVLLNRGPLLIACVLGIWKAGAVFVPLDPSTPEAHIGWIIEDAQVSLLLTHAQLEFLPAGLRVLTEAQLAGPSASELEPVVLAPHDLAYLIYTSGSTGRPKGVQVEHVGLPNLAAAQQAVLDIGQGDRVLQCASFTFDGAVFEVTLALANSASLVLGSLLDLMSGEPLAHFLQKNRITHAILVPSALSQLPVQSFADLRVVCVAGEECPLPLAQRWAERVTFFNLYGPTEASIWTTWARILPSEQHRPPIGVPIANTQVYVLDEQRRPVPFGVAGELYIGGIGLARGYQGRPDLTQERFLPHPFSSEGGAQLYKTGDRVRWRGDGQLEFLGRLDEQVKVRGYRVELREIEIHLEKLPQVQQAAVVVNNKAHADLQRLA